jgi:hypothetical protein
MQRNVLHAHKILAARCALGDRECYLLLPRASEAHLPAGEGGALAVDFEPDGAAAVEGGSGLARGDFGHVELEGAGVRDGGDGGEADGVACVDRGGHGRSGAGGELIAADLVGGDVGYGAIGLVVCCFAWGDVSL